jgi:hypothetical protein
MSARFQRSNKKASGVNKPMWAAVLVLGVAVLAMVATLIRILSGPVEPRLVVLPDTATPVCANCGSVEAVTPVQGDGIASGGAGNRLAKKIKKEPAYQVLVRMEDGTVRTLEQSTAPTPGARVIIDGNTLQSASR